MNGLSSHISKHIQTFNQSAGLCAPSKKWKTLISALQQRLRPFLCCIALLLTSGNSIHAHAESVDKKKLLKIEAAYLYKFTKFIKWPDFRFNQSSNLNLCLVGEDLTDLNRLLSKGISGKQSNGRTLHVYHYSGDTLGEEGRNCHLIYFDELAAETFSKDIDETATLLISSPNNQHTDHSLIFLQIQNGKLVFFVNQKRLEASLLEFNAALLSLARRKL